MYLHFLDCLFLFLCFSMVSCFLLAFEASKDWKPSEENFAGSSEQSLRVLRREIILSDYVKANSCSWPWCEEGVWRTFLVDEQNPKECSLHISLLGIARRHMYWNLHAAERFIISFQHQGHSWESSSALTWMYQRWQWVKKLRVFSKIAIPEGNKGRESSWREKEREWKLASLIMAEERKYPNCQRNR